MLQSMPCKVLGKHTIVDLFGRKGPLIASHALPSMQYCYEKSIFAKQITKKNYIYIYMYGCHLLLDVCIIYFISCDCIMNSSLSYTIY